jgi:predicted nuclease of predicted toxin-antitoxin system
MKILIDMNLSPDWVQTFAEAGIDSVHWLEIGDIRAADRVINVSSG